MLDGEPSYELTLSSLGRAADTLGSRLPLDNNLAQNQSSIFEEVRAYPQCNPGEKYTQ